MKYEKPEVRALVPAISAIQANPNKPQSAPNDGGVSNEGIGAYEDWE